MIGVCRSARSNSNRVDVDPYLEGIAAVKFISHSNGDERRATVRSIEHVERLIKNEKWLTATEVARLMHLPKHVADEINYETINNMKQDRRLFGVKYRGEVLYPLFQFAENGSPKFEMAMVLSILPRDEYGWAAAFWFFQSTALLDGKSPANVYVQDAVAVIRAARSDFVRQDSEF